MSVFFSKYLLAFSRHFLHILRESEQARLGLIGECLIWHLLCTFTTWGRREREREREKELEDQTISERASEREREREREREVYCFSGPSRGDALVSEVQSRGLV